MCIHVAPLGDGGPSVFYKEYRFARPSWRFFGRPSKARREYHNLRWLAGRGVPCAEAIACGEQRDALGRLVAAFVITAAVADALPLDRFVAERCDGWTLPAHAPLRRAMLDQLAGQVAIMHQAGFAHNDLHWRNVLASTNADGLPRLRWIDCPRGGRVWPGLARRKRRKDLATLDRTAASLCSLRERLRFVCRYRRALGRGEPARLLAARVDGYRKRRWRDADMQHAPPHATAD